MPFRSEFTSEGTEGLDAAHLVAMQVHQVVHVELLLLREGVLESYPSGLDVGAW